MSLIACLPGIYKRKAGAFLYLTGKMMAVLKETIKLNGKQEGK